MIVFAIIVSCLVGAAWGAATVWLHYNDPDK